MTDGLVFNSLDHLVCDAKHRVAGKTYRDFSFVHIVIKTRQFHGPVNDLLKILIRYVRNVRPTHHATGKNIVFVFALGPLNTIGGHQY